VKVKDLATHGEKSLKDKTLCKTKVIAFMNTQLSILTNTLETLHHIETSVVD